MRVVILTALFAVSAHAQSVVPADMTEAQRVRAERLYKEIRCPTCTAQSVADSEAQLSRDMRRRIDTLIVAGKTDEEVRSELSTVYGDDIRLRPKSERRTWLLWAAPWLVILAGGVLIVTRRRH